MLRILTFLLISSFSLPFMHGQIIETEKAMNTGVNNALVLEIPNADDKIVEKVWKNYAKSFDAKVKKVKKSEDYITGSPKIAGFSQAGLSNIFVRFEQKGDNVQFMSWFEMRDQYLNSYSHPEEFDEAQKLLLNFGLEVAKEYTMMELGEEEKEMKTMHNQMKRLVKEKENYEKSILDFQQKIIDAEANIANNIIEQERMQTNMESQSESIEGVKKKLINLDN